MPSSRSYQDGKFGKVFVSHVDLNDDVVEGLQCVDIPAFSVQYHPEAAAGPHDAAYLFDRFVAMMNDANAKNAKERLTEGHRGVERSLAAERGQQCVWAFLGDDAFEDRRGDRLDVGGIRHLRVGHATAASTSRSRT